MDCAFNLTDSIPNFNCTSMPKEMICPLSAEIEYIKTSFFVVNEEGNSVCNL